MRTSLLGPTMHRELRPVFTQSESLVAGCCPHNTAVFSGVPCAITCLHLGLELCSSAAIKTGVFYDYICEGAVRYWFMDFLG